jgi:hypothetical protein
VAETNEMRLASVIGIVLGVLAWMSAPAMATGRNDVAVVRADGGSGTYTIPAPPHSRFLVSPCWMPDGRLVTVAEHPAAIVRRAIPGAPTVLQPLSSRFVNGRFGPGCGDLAEIRQRAHMEVWLRPHGLPAFRVLTTTAYWETQPQFAWSADGRHVAVGDRSFPGSVRVLNARSGVVLRRFAATLLYSVSAQALSADGRFVVFTTGTSAYDFAVHVGDVRTGRVRTLARHALDAAWSPNGDKIAVARLGVIEILDETGSPIARVNIPSGEMSAPAWSPNGLKLALLFARSDELLTSRVAVATVTDAPILVASQRLGPTSSLVSEPQWSSDGQMIAVSREPFVPSPGDD